MFSVVDAADDGRLTLWRTRAPDVGVPPPPGALLLTPWGEAVPAPVRPPAPTAPGLAPTMRRRKIENGEILFLHDDASFYVVKRQRVDPPVVDDVATPRPPTCERKALEKLNELMLTQRIAPVFCETRENLGASPPPPGATEITMCAYLTDLSDWVRRGEPARTSAYFDYPADVADHWLYTRFAGHHLLASPFASDKLLFNEIVRATLLQVRGRAPLNPLATAVPWRQLTRGVWGGPAPP